MFYQRIVLTKHYLQTELLPQKYTQRTYLQQVFIKPFYQDHLTMQP